MIVPGDWSIAMRRSIRAKASRVTVEYDDLYGANSGPWTTADFIGAVYTSLKQGRPKAERK
jgi:hypothetical protein